MRMRAAVLRAAGEPLSVAEVELADIIAARHRLANPYHFAPPPADGATG